MADAVTEVRGRIAAATSGTGNMPGGGGEAGFTLARPNDRNRLPRPVIPGTPGYDALIKSQSRPDDEPAIVLLAPASPDGTFDPGAVKALDPMAAVMTAHTSQPVAMPAPLAATKRVVVSYGPKEGVLVVAVEVAPDWDSDESPIELETAVVKAFLPVIKQLGIKVKSLVPGL